MRSTAVPFAASTVLTRITNLEPSGDQVPPRCAEHRRDDERGDDAPARFE
jgi:hypothetical protein